MTPAPTPTGVILASDSDDAAAAEAVRAHHAELAAGMALRVGALVDAVTDGRDDAPARAALVSFCEVELLPHATAEEQAMYPPAQADPRGRLLVEGMIAEHRVITELVRAIRDAASPVRAAAEAHALHVVFESHLSKENDLVLPLLAADPDVSLADALAGMHDLLGEEATAGEAGGSGCGGGGGGCGCGHQPDATVPELDVRAIPHAVRHATVFGALGSLASGQALVLSAPHDPLPLLAQLEQREPGAFEVAYREAGPEVWRLLLTRR